MQLYFSKYNAKPALSNPRMRKKKIKTTAPRIPAWSPTVVLTRRHSG